MSRLDDLIRDVTQMSDEELLQLTKSIRADRRVSKRVQRTQSVRKQTATKDRVASILDKMSPEERAALLRKFKK